MLPARSGNKLLPNDSSRIAPNKHASIVLKWLESVSTQLFVKR